MNNLSKHIVATVEIVTDMLSNLLLLLVCCSESALEDEMFEDGAETHRECNVCVGLQELGVHCSDMPQ